MIRITDSNREEWEVKKIYQMVESGEGQELGSPMNALPFTLRFTNVKTRKRIEVPLSRSDRKRVDSMGEAELVKILENHHPPA